MLDRLLSRLQQVSTRTAMLLGLLLVVPSVFVGWFADDWMLRHALRVDGGGLRAALRLYQFTHTFPQPGVWFATPGYRNDLLRPLSGLLFLADDTLGPFFAHLHSLAWWALLLGVVSRLFRRFLSAPVAALALVLFAIDDVHWGPLAWIANRHCLVATTLVFAGLDAQLRERKALSWVLFALGLAAGEAAVQALAMVVVFAVVERRYTRIAAPAVLVAAYAVVRRVLGVGVAGSGQYLDPMVNPLGFVKAAPARLAALLGDLLGGVPSDLWLSMPAMRPRLVATGVVVTALVVWLTLRALKTMEPAARRTLVGLVAAGILAMLPGLAGVPGSRIVFASSVASAALVATLLVQLRSAWRWWLVVTHVVMAPLMLLGDQAQVRTMAAATDRAMAQTALVGDVAVVSAPDAFVAIYPPYIDTRYRSYRLLTLTPRDVAVTRVGARSLRVETVTGAFFDSAMEESVRPVAPKLGTTVRQGAMTATVESPRALRFDWDVPLEAVRVTAWQGGALRPLALPAVGETVTVRREVGMMGL